MGGYGLEPTLSMHQYAMRQLEDGDSAAGLEAFDREAVPIENWLAAQADRQKRGEAAALFIFVISIGMALVGSMLSSALTAPSAFVAVIAVAAYVWIRLELRRLVAKRDDLKSLPEPFQEAFNGKLGVATKNLFSGGYSVLDTRGNLTSLRRDVCALDVIWLIESPASLGLKVVLISDQTRFPTSVSLVMDTASSPSEQQDANKQALYSQSSAATVVPDINSESGKIKEPALTAKDANVVANDPDDAIAVPIYSGSELPEFEKYWLAIHDPRKTLARIEAFKKHLPLKYAWMALPVEKAFHRCKRDPYIGDKELFDIVWANLEQDPNWTKAGTAKDKETVRRLIYRDRSSIYDWVREYFTDLSRPHKYAPEDQSAQKQPLLPFGSAADSDR
jgi:hypothetical protein